MLKLYKYNYYFSYLILSAYLFFFILNIFHFHQISISTLSQIRNEKESSSNKSDILFPNSNFICQFQNNFTSIQTADDLENFVFSLDDKEKRLSFDDKLYIQFLKNFPRNNPLRAPPSGK